MFKKIINFIKYHNAFAIGMSLVLVSSGVIFAASPGLRENTKEVLISSEEIVRSIDNSQILAADLDNFDFGLHITEITEDDLNYYVSYTYRTLEIEDYAWQEVEKEKTFDVPKDALAGKDLGLYVTEQLGQVIDNQLSYLKEVQEIEQKKGLTQKVATVQYAGLLGKFLSPTEKVFPGYEPVVKPPKVVFEPEIVQEPICQPSEEICDGADNNCDGQVDEGGVCEVLPTKGGKEVPPEPTCDADHLDLCTTQELCEGISFYWYNETCNSAEPETPACQLSEEICDSLDNDCDELIDEDLGQTTCGVGACTVTIDNCIGGQSQTCTPGTPTEEICDQIDNNCDGQVDEGGICEAPPAEPICDASHLNLCSTETDCQSAGGVFDSEKNTCNEKPKCQPNWQCSSDWQPVVPENLACSQIFKQTRTCTDGCDNEKTEEQELKGTYCEQGTCDLEKGECQLPPSAEATGGS